MKSSSNESLRGCRQQTLSRLYLAGSAGRRGRRGWDHTHSQPFSSVSTVYWWSVDPPNCQFGDRARVYPTIVDGALDFNRYQYPSKNLNTNIKSRTIHNLSLMSKNNNLGLMSKTMKTMSNVYLCKTQVCGTYDKQTIWANVQKQQFVFNVQEQGSERGGLSQNFNLSAHSRPDWICWSRYIFSWIMSGLEGVSLMVVVMDRGLLGLLLCLVVMCVAGAVGASIRLKPRCSWFLHSLCAFVFVFCICCSVLSSCALLELLGLQSGWPRCIKYVFVNFSLI